MHQTALPDTLTEKGRIDHLLSTSSNPDCN